MEGDIGDLSKKISKDLRSDGSIKDGEEKGLRDGSEVAGEVLLGRGGNSSNVKAEGISMELIVCGFKTGGSE